MMAKFKIFGQKQEFPNVKALAPIDRKSAFLFLRESGMTDIQIADVYSVSVQAVARVFAQPPFRLKTRDAKEKEQLPEPVPPALVFDRKSDRHFAVLRVLIEKRCSVSLVTLADSLHITESEVQTSLKKLVADGLIVRAEQTARNMPHKYNLTEKGVVWSAQKISSEVDVVPSPPQRPVLKRVQHARSAPIFRVLAVIADSGSKGISRIEAGAKIGMQTDSVSHHYKSLLRKGWIEQLRAHQGTTPGLFGITGPGVEALEDAI